MMSWFIDGSSFAEGMGSAVHRPAIVATRAFARHHRFVRTPLTLTDRASASAMQKKYKKKAGFLRPFVDLADVADQQRPSLQSSALSSTFSPTFCTSWPAPAIVLHAARVLIEKRDSSNRAVKRFIWFS